MFQGFSPETLDFMWGIRFNNEKVWFEAHKEAYLRVLYHPMKELSQQVHTAVLEHNQDLDLSAKVSRIYRDARRLRGQGPYKDHLWCSMERRTEDWTAHPAFWFELEPEGYTWGMGYYMPKALTMAKFRARLDREPKVFETLARAFEKQTIFTLEGEDYKKPRGESTARLAPWYQKKTLSLIGRGEPSETFSADFADKLVAGYERLLPLYRYFLMLEGDPDPRERTQAQK